jgi:hypothetical protein
VCKYNNGTVCFIYFNNAYGSKMLYTVLVTIAYCAGGPVVADRSAKNRLEALFTLLKTEPLTKRCPLIWRLYLHFLYDHGAESTWRTAFYRAVEECPWIKVSDCAKFVILFHYLLLLLLLHALGLHPLWLLRSIYYHF